jgi:hypothetical protein
MFRVMSRRERIIFHALMVIEDALDASNTARVPASTSLRLALGILHLLADRKSEFYSPRTYVSFWQEATERDAAGISTANGFGRWQTLNACANAMAHAVGMPRDHGYDEKKRRYRAA